jgi:hypothetical protein
MCTTIPLFPLCASYGSPLPFVSLNAFTTVQCTKARTVGFTFIHWTSTLHTANFKISLHVRICFDEKQKWGFSINPNQE